MTTTGQELRLPFLVLLPSGDLGTEHQELLERNSMDQGWGLNQDGFRGVPPPGAPCCSHCLEG